jgi:hypothetical protein
LGWPQQRQQAKSSPGLEAKKEGDKLGSIFDEEFEPFLDWNGEFDKHMPKAEIRQMLKKMLKADFYYATAQDDEKAIRFLGSNDMIFLPLFTSMSELCQLEGSHSRKIAKIEKARELLRDFHRPCGIVVNPFGRSIILGSEQLFGDLWDDLAKDE